MQIGIRQELEVVELLEHGALLGKDEVLLPTKWMPAGLQIGQVLTVFVGVDRNGTPQATTETPYAEYGEFAFLEVVDVAPHGAYLDWGLERDLFLPNGLQYDEPRVGKKLFVAIDLDDRGRLFASNRLVEYFDEDLSTLREGQEVELWVYGSNGVGTLVIVDGRWRGIVYANQVWRPIERGARMAGWITQLRADGKLDICLQRPGKAGIRDARALLWQALIDNDGQLDLHDRSSPEAIRSKLQMSKKAFKKALGGLYKDRMVELTSEGIRQASPAPVLPCAGGKHAKTTKKG